MEQLVFKDIASPLGLISTIAGSAGLAAITWEGEGLQRKLATPMRDDSHIILLETEKQLAGYFDKKRDRFDVPLAFKVTAFREKVWTALLTIPFGETRTYGELAAMTGDSKAVRAVGGALNKNPIPILVPCHRVIGAAGKLVGFAGGVKNKSIRRSWNKK